MGAHATRLALKKGWLVRGVDKVTYAANLELLEEFNKYPNFTFERRDIKNLKFLHDCDYVINFAAESHVGNSIVNSDDFISSNVVGVKNLLDLIRFKPINCNDRPVFFHISTDEVYGDIDSGAHTEQDLLKPSNPYSAAKASADMLIHAWARTYNIDYIILRPTNNYGIGQFPEKLIPLSVKNLVRGKKIRLHNAGTPIRNWLHAEDTATAVMSIIEAGKINEIYNVSGGFEQTNVDTVKKIIKSYYGSVDDWEQYVNLNARREGQDVRYALDDSKLKSIGWRPQKKFDEEVDKIVNYYKEKFIW
tara:strand:- start:626 stop:1540 length:915 start_codon:yes stop_codon:yes gene_type:complete